MPLLPRVLSRRFAGGGLLGYESQLGSGLKAIGEAAGKVGDALYQNLPPLAVPYLHVKNAAPVDPTAALAALDADGQKQADALLKDLEKKMAENLKDARMTAGGAAEWSGSSNALLKKIYDDVSKNPAAFSNPTYRAKLAMDTNKLLDPGQFNSKRNTFDGYNTLRTSSKEQLNDRAVINGVRQVATNDQLIGQGLTTRDLGGQMQMLGLLPAQMSPEQMQKMQGVDFSEGLLDKIKGGIQEGNFDDTQKIIQEWRNAIHPSESGNSSKSEGIATITTGGLGAATEQRIVSKGGSRFTTTNGPRLRELRARIEQGGWQAALGNPKAVTGMYKAMNDRVDGTALRSEVKLADGTVLPAGTNRYTAEQEAYKRGDQAQYRYLMGRRETLVQERAIDYLNQEMGLGLVSGTKTSDESGIGGEVGKPAADGDGNGTGKLDFWGQFKTGHPGLDAQTVSLNNPDGKYVTEPDPLTGRPKQVWKATTEDIQVTLLPRKEKLEMDAFLKTGAGDKERRKTLAEFTGSSVLATPGRPLFSGNKWAGGMDPNKFEVVGHEGMTKIVEPGQEANLAAVKSYGQLMAQELTRAGLSPAQRAYYDHERITSEQVAKTMLQPYHIVRVSSDMRSYAPVNKLLSYKSRSGKDVTPILGNPDSSFIMPNIASDNPYGMSPLQDSDEQTTDRGHTGYGSIGNDQGLTMKVYVRDENTVSNDASAYRIAGNDLVGNVKNYVNDIQQKALRLQGERRKLSPAK